MAGRPKPTILMSVTDPKTYRADEVLSAKAIFAVFLDGQPIALRSLHTLIDGLSKYPRTSFGNPGHAFNLAAKLNARFHTERFAVHMLATGPVIREDDG